MSYRQDGNGDRQDGNGDLRLPPGVSQVVELRVEFDMSTRQTRIMSAPQDAILLNHILREVEFILFRNKLQVEKEQQRIQPVTRMLKLV